MWKNRWPPDARSAVRRRWILSICRRCIQRWWKPSPEGGCRRPMMRWVVAAAIHAADAGLKGAEVRLVEVRLADGLGGKGIVLFSGLVADVEAAVEIGVGVLEQPTLLVRQVVIPQLHQEVWENVSDDTHFRARVIDKL
ncbi:MAG: hypothetical protein B6I34_07135 [Anaerolineaceae bacterium 4572_32.1]|nr:MAG: hypothetical protein B6I34_07135 [Anaerolineaceae bacterium 4572_32.1]